MKKLSYLFLLIIVALIASGCSNQDQLVADTFEAGLESSTWSADFMGYSGTVQFDGNGTGTVTSSGRTVDFTYTISDINEEDLSANITFENTGISQIDGKTIKATLVSGGLKVSYNGLSVTLKPDSGE